MDSSRKNGGGPHGLQHRTELWDSGKEVSLLEGFEARGGMPLPHCPVCNKPVVGAAAVGSLVKSHIEDRGGPDIWYVTHEKCTIKSQTPTGARRIETRLLKNPDRYAVTFPGLTKPMTPWKKADLKFFNDHPRRSTYTRKVFPGETHPVFDYMVIRQNEPGVHMTSPIKNNLPMLNNLTEEQSSFLHDILLAGDDLTGEELNKKVEQLLVPVPGSGTVN